MLFFWWPSCDCRSKRRTRWLEENLPEIADEINILNLTSKPENQGLLDPYVIMKKKKDSESLAIDILTF